MARLLPPLALCALATALRFYRIGAQSLWYDEGISAHQVTRSFADVARAAALDTHPPLYYWLLKIWGGTFGQTELGLRSLSAVLGVAAVGLTWLIGRRLFGAGVAAIAGLLVGCSPLTVYYSQEVRMYALVLACGLLATWAYLRRSPFLFALAAAATLYSQYLGVAYLAALHLHALVWWRTRRRRDWLRWLGANAVAALLFLPWLPTVVEQSTGRALNTSPRTPGELLRETLAAYGGGAARGDLPLFGGALLVALALLGVVLAGRQWRNAASLALLLWLGPLALVVALGLRSGLFEVRYLLLSVPGLALLAGLGTEWLAIAAARSVRRVAAGPSPAAAGAVAAILLAAVLIPAATSLSRQYFDPALARDDYRGAVRAIESQAQPADAVVLIAPNQVEVFSFYYHGGLPVYPLPAQRPIDDADTRQRLEALRAEHDRVWLLAWAVADADPHRVVETWLAQNGFQASHAWYGGLQLELITLQGDGGALEPLNLPLDNGIDLEGYRLATRSLAPGDTLPITLVWRARDVPTERWKVFTHILDARPFVVAQRDAEPDGELRPTTTWLAGERVEDHYGIAIPAGLAPGTYTVEIGMYQGDRRASFAGRGDHLVLGTIAVSARQ